MFSFLERTKKYPYWETCQVCVVLEQTSKFYGRNSFSRYFHEGTGVLIIHYLGKNRRVTNTIDIAPWFLSESKELVAHDVSVLFSHSVSGNKWDSWSHFSKSEPVIA